MKCSLISSLILAALILLGGACTSTETKYVYSINDSLKGNVVADTIIYDVIVKFRKGEDGWTKNALKNVKLSKFVNEVFEAVYEGKYKAYDHFTNELLSNGDIKEIESNPDYSRDKIGSLQFTELWYYNDQKQLFSKEVLSIAFGSEKYASDGTFRGYTPIFRVYLR